MAKLSVYKTIDRSQLGGKFVPLIHSGVNNYKILASDLGKEYSPGDAIDITDTGVINVNYDHNALKLSGSELCVKTDYNRGVFIGSDGIYIASADSTINVGLAGISVNRSDLVSRIPGAGLTVKGDRLYVKSADDTIGVSSDGIKVNTSALSIPDAYSLAGRGLGAVDSNTLYVQPANGSISLSSAGVKVDASFLAGHYLSVGSSNHDIIVDTASVARAITGSGLVETNGTIGVNVNTATGIIVNDNKLYLNAGSGLYNINNTVRVKRADDTINVSPSGISVNYGYGIAAISEFSGLTLKGLNSRHTNLSLTVRNFEKGYIYADTYYMAGSGLVASATYIHGSSNDAYTVLNVKSSDGSIFVNGSGIGVDLRNAEYVGAGLTNSIGELAVKAADNTIGVSSNGIKVNTGYGLSATSYGLYVKSADDTISVSEAGIRVNKSALSIPSASSLVGIGLCLHSNESQLQVKPADSTIDVSPAGIKVIGYGLSATSDGLAVKSADGSIYVSDSGIGVSTTVLSSSLAGYGLSVKSGGLYVKSADNTIGVSSNGIKVNPSALAGGGLAEHVDGGSLQVLPSDSTISVSTGGVRVNYGPGLTKDSYGRLVSALYAGSGVRLKNNYISIHTGLGLTAGDGGVKVDPYALAGAGLKSSSNNTLYVCPADNTINVSSGGIKVNVQSGGGILAGDQGLYIDSGALSIPTASSLVGSGLTVKGDRLYVKSSDDSIDVSAGGIRVNAYSLAGFGISSINGSTLNVDYTSFAGRGLTYTDSSLYVQSADNSIGVGSLGIKVNSGYGLETNAYGLSAKAANVTVNVSPDGISVPIRSGGGILAGSDGLYLDSGSISGWLAGDGLENKYNILYVKSADNTIGVSSDGIRVNAGYGLSAVHNGLYVKSADGSIDVSTSGIKVDAGPGLETMPIGLSVKSADGSIYVSGTGIGVDLRKAKYVGSGLTNSTGELAVKAADNTIDVSSDGIKVHIPALSIPTTSSLAGDGLQVDPVSGSSLYVESANDSISVSWDGVKVNPTALAGYSLYVDSANKTLNVNTDFLAGRGLENEGGFNVKAADDTISVSSDGIKVNSSSLAGGGLTTYGSTLYVLSGDSSIDVRGGGDGIRVKAGYGLETTSNGLYVKSAGGTIGVTSSGIGVNVQSGGGILTGINGLYIDSAQLAGSGLGYKGDANKVKLYVIPADNTITVGSDGIKVNKSALSIPTTSSLAGQGLQVGPESSLYVQSADDTIDVSSDGIKVNTSALPTPTAESLAGQGLKSNASGKLDIYCGSGLDIDKSLGKVIVKSADNSIDVSDNGIKVRTYDNQGVFVGNHGVYTRSADSSIGLSTAGIKVNVKSGGGILVGDQGLYIDNTSSSSSIEGIDVDAMGASATAGSGSVSVGSGANAAGGYSISVGVLANATANESVVIGYLSSANVDSSRSIAIGSESRVGSAFSVAIGNTSKAYSESSVVIGDLAYTLSAHSIAIGRMSYTYAGSAIAIGPYSVSNGYASIAIGSESYANSASTIAIGYSSSSGTNSVAIGAGSSAPNTYCLSAGYMSSATGTESVALGVNSDASSFGVAIGSQSNALEYGVAIGYNASATKGIISLRVAHSTGEHFEYKYGYDGSLIDKDTSGANYTRSWENLLTPPDYSAAVSINVNTEYTADKPAYIAFNVYAGGAKVYVVEFIKNDVPVFSVGVLYGLSIYNIIPIAKGDKYKLSVTNHGAVNPAIYAYIIYPQ